MSMVRVMCGGEGREREGEKEWDRKRKGNGRSMNRMEDVIVDAHFNDVVQGTVRL
jgi:hypothetical protein